ncbi:MAG: translation initiation factor IF-2 associated domain-containing protein, partial [Pseudomonadota bacterium]
MTDTKTSTGKKTLKLGDRGKLELRKSQESGQVRQSFSHGRTKAVTVEVKRKRVLDQPVPAERPEPTAEAQPKARPSAKSNRTLTRAEREIRERVLRSAMREEEERAQSAPPPVEPEPAL